MGSLGMLAERARGYDCNRNILDHESKERALACVMPESACTLVCFKYTIITLTQETNQSNTVPF